MSTNANAPTLMDEMLGRATVKSPAMNDICFGRGGYSNRHHGNKAYLELLEQHEVAYVSCARKYQKLLSVCIIHQLRCKGIRFLKKNEKTGTWGTVKLSLCRLKISQRLRERAPMNKMGFSAPPSAACPPAVAPAVAARPERAFSADLALSPAQHYEVLGATQLLPPPLPAAGAFADHPEKVPSIDLMSTLDPALGYGDFETTDFAPPSLPAARPFAGAGTRADSSLVTDAANVPLPPLPVARPFAEKEDSELSTSASQFPVPPLPAARTFSEEERTDSNLVTDADSEAEEGSQASSFGGEDIFEAVFERHQKKQSLKRSTSPLELTIACTPQSKRQKAITTTADEERFLDPVASSTQQLPLTHDYAASLMRGALLEEDVGTARTKSSDEKQQAMAGPLGDSLNDRDMLECLEGFL